MRARVETELCVACGACEEICPQVFRVGCEIADLRVEVVPEEARKACHRAMEECYSGAIDIEE